MGNINVFLRERLVEISAKRIYIAPNIEEKKLNNAIGAFDYAGKPGNVVAVYDDTLLGSAKEGLLFTGEQVIYRPLLGKPQRFPYSDLLSAQYLEVPIEGKAGKVDKLVRLSQVNGASIDIRGAYLNLPPLADILQQAISNFENHQEEAQSIPIEDMAESLKVAYVKIAVNAAYENRQELGHKVFAELMLLTTRLNLNEESRMAVRVYIAASDQRELVEKLVADLDHACPDGQIHLVHVSLVKELINLHHCMTGRYRDQFAFLDLHQQLFSVTEADVELVVLAIKSEHDMLKEDVTDDQLTETMKLLSAKAAAVGTPLAAVYLSGSVIGMSAAGMTSGLATLGLGGILGLSSMATGIGVAVLIGVGTYAGIRKLTGANELTRFKRRGLMLAEVIKQTQLTLSLLVSDINSVTLRLNDQIKMHGAQSDKIEKLMRLMTQLTGAGKVLNERSEAAQSSATKLSCARYLDEERVRSLTRDPTRQELGEWIISHYEPHMVQETKDETTVEVERLVLKADYGVRELEDLAQSFQAIGYFSVSDVVAGKVTDLASKATRGISNLWS
ncbi:hypothetical protein [Stenotrophomonas sp. ZAC14D2_NAIMI4_6]|uniref:hypothetical protein n=1 Tax=Stenotrophomonas sp. ZAC14D2_NAIMI4_6 TaxID=2072406 RepID=UPI000D53FBDA|nr:hypothetical protein [Stenotrophomonas sp. ZAC14D2_NAIMI4_6]AWH20115.1 hypothetical protein C1933_02055 [Stenotrophomonas sp. ZAC14D2_NAIMI4_6]